jgi:hypothetical protein
MDKAVSIGDFGHDIDVCIGIIDPSPPLAAFDD